MKKYLFLIPTLFVMLLNVISCGQVVNAASTDYDMSYFYSDSFFYSFDFGNSIFDRVYDFASNSTNFKYYFYQVYLTKSHYTNYENGSGDFDIVCRIYTFSSNISIEDSIGSDDFIVSDSSYSFRYDFLCRLDASDLEVKDSSSFGLSGNNIFKFFYYNKSDGRINSSSDPLSSVSYSDRVILYESTNIDDLPLVPFDPVSSGLNVDVHFKPTLSGEVDRLITDSNGDTSLSNRMRFTLTNNSKFAIQYSLFIVKKSDDFDLTAVLDDSCVFVYYSNDWVYSSSIDDAPSYLNQLPQKQNKATSHHYVAAGESTLVLFNYSQINLVEGQEYTVYVMASRCDYDLASELIVSPVEEIYPEMKQVYRSSLVYQSDFSMVHYSDVKYDPKDNSNGVVPYSSHEDMQKYGFSYNAKENPDGTIDYNSKDIYTDKNSWYYDSSSWQAPGTHGSSGGSGVSSSFNSFAHSFSGFFSFVNSVFNYFPSSFKTIVSLGLTSVVIVGLIKVVFR